MEKTNQKTLSLPQPGAYAIIIAALLWSVDGLLRRSLYALPPTTVVFWEHIVGLIIIAPIVLVSFKEFKKFTKKQIVAIALVALFSGALGTIFYTAALGKIYYIQFSVVVLLQQLQPLFAIAAASIVVKEKLTLKFMALAILALIAAYFVSFPNLTVNLATGAGTVIAALLAVGAAICWGSSTAFSKYALQNTSFWHTTALRFTFTPIFALLLSLGLRQLGQLGGLGRGEVFTLIAIAFSTGLVALLIYYWGLKRTPVRVTTLLELAWPVSAIIIGYFAFHQTLTVTQVIGAIVLIAVMYQVAKIRS